MNWTGIFPTIMARFWLSDILRLFAQIQGDLSPGLPFGNILYASKNLRRACVRQLSDKILVTRAERCNTSGHRRFWPSKHRQSAGDGHALFNQLNKPVCCNR